jgi:hypothetical protein
MFSNSLTLSSGRAAFEYCIASLYGAEPRLVLPPWARPSAEHPLTPCWSGKAQPRSLDCEEWALPLDCHAATPRFLLSLLSTALYLGIMSVSARANALILSSLGPWTVSMYLRFALGEGIDALPGFEPDEELDGPVLLRDSTELGAPCDDPDDTPADESEDMVLSEPVTPRSPTAPRSAHTSSPGPGPGTSAARRLKPRFQHGPMSVKLGEAAASWLMRWGADVFDAEERGAYASPALQARTSWATAPPLAIWSHASMGGISATWVRGIIASDSLHVASELERWELARRVVDLRRSQAQPSDGTSEYSLAHESDGDSGPTMGTPLQQGAPRSPTMRQHVRAASTSGDSAWDAAAEEAADEAEYAELFASGIYYTHMLFDDLSGISALHSPHTGQPYTTMEGLQAALWAQEKLKDKVLKGSSLQEASREDSDDAEVESERSTAPRNTEVAVVLGLSSTLAEFETAQARMPPPPTSRSSRAGTPMSFRSAASARGLSSEPQLPPPLELGGFAGGLGSGASLFTKRYFPVPLDDTVRFGDSLTALAPPHAAAFVEVATTRERNFIADPLMPVDGALGMAVARDPGVIAVHSAGAKDREAFEHTAIVASRTPEHFFGFANMTHTGAVLAAECRTLREQLEAAAAAKPEDESITSEAAAVSYGPEEIQPDLSTSPLEQSRWSAFEPMRLSVEFWGVDALEHSADRLYSPTFFYAGSLWNLYVQTVKKQRGLQLGIYLHRQSPNEEPPMPSAPPGTTGTLSRRGHILAWSAAAPPEAEGQEEEADLSGDVAATADGASFLPTSHSDGPASAPAAGATFSGPSRNTRSSTSQPASKASLTIGGLSPTSRPIMPYVDTRERLRVYFSIHCPSPLGSFLTRFSSAPDSFTLSQSWGWKSSSLLGCMYLPDGELVGVQARNKPETAPRFRCSVTLGLV